MGDPGEGDGHMHNVQNKYLQQAETDASNALTTAKAQSAYKAAAAKVARQVAEVAEKELAEAQATEKDAAKALAQVRQATQCELSTGQQSTSAQAELARMRQQLQQERSARHTAEALAQQAEAARRKLLTAQGGHSGALVAATPALRKEGGPAINKHREDGCATSSLAAPAAAPESDSADGRQVAGEVDLHARGAGSEFGNTNAMNGDGCGSGLDNDNNDSNGDGDDPDPDDDNSPDDVACNAAVPDKNKRRQEKRAAMHAAEDCKEKDEATAEASGLQRPKKRRSLTNTTGDKMYRGLSRTRGLYQVKLCLPERKQVHVGMFRDATWAAEAYDRAALKHFGDAAILNFERERYAGAEEEAQRASLTTEQYLAHLRPADKRLGGSGWYGVTRKKRANGSQWYAQLRRCSTFGNYKTVEEAITAFDLGVLLCFGASTRTNRPLANYVDLTTNRLLPSIVVPPRVQQSVDMYWKESAPAGAVRGEGRALPVVAPPSNA